MDQAQQIDIQNLQIVPLTKASIRGQFNFEDGDFRHLINWIRTGAVLSQREKKSKTYIAQYEERVVGFITVSMGVFEGDIQGLSNSTGFEFQVLLIGKLYVVPECRSCGIGSVLLNLAVDIAQNIDEMTGCIGIVVDANDNPRTLGFYERFGFERLEEADRTVKMFFRLPEQPVIGDRS